MLTLMPHLKEEEELMPMLHLLELMPMLHLKEEEEQTPMSTLHLKGCRLLHLRPHRHLHLHLQETHLVVVNHLQAPLKEEDWEDPAGWAEDQEGQEGPQDQEGQEGPQEQEGQEGPQDQEGQEGHLVGQEDHGPEDQEGQEGHPEDQEVQGGAQQQVSFRERYLPSQHLA